jgi:hypothetical protein
MMDNELCSDNYFLAAGFTVKNSYQIPLNPPFAKGDFLRDVALSPPLEKGG